MDRPSRVDRSDHGDARLVVRQISNPNPNVGGLNFVLGPRSAPQDAPPESRIPSKRASMWPETGPGRVLNPWTVNSPSPWLGGEPRVEMEPRVSA